MSTEPATDGRAQIELWKIVAELQRCVDSGKLDGATLIHGCRNILDLWVDGGGSSLHDAVIGFLGIESQTDHVLGGSQAIIGREIDHVRFESGSPDERAEVEELRQFFGDQFGRNLHDLALFLDDA